MTKSDLYLQFFSVHISVCCCFADVKADMESRLIEWQSELEELSVYFKKLCKSRKNSLLKEEEDTLVTYVADKQLQLVKKVNISFRKQIWVATRRLKMPTKKICEFKANIACRVLLF